MSAQTSGQLVIVGYIDDTGARTPVTPSTPLPGSGGAGGGATETTLQGLLTEAQTTNTLLSSTPSALAHQPLDATSDLTAAFVTSSSSGEQDMITATASQTSRIHRMTITAAAATVVEIRDGASGTPLKTIEFPAAGAFVFDFSERPYVKSSTNTKLVRNSTVATKVTIDFEYVKSA